MRWSARRTKRQRHTVNRRRGKCYTVARHSGKMPGRGQAVSALPMTGPTCHQWDTASNGTAKPGVDGRRPARTGRRFHVGLAGVAAGGADCTDAGRRTGRGSRKPTSPDRAGVISGRLPDGRPTSRTERTSSADLSPGRRRIRWHFPSCVQADRPGSVALSFAAPGLCGSRSASSTPTAHRAAVSRKISLYSVCRAARTLSSYSASRPA